MKTRPFFFNLTKKLLIYLLVTSIIPLLVLGWISSRISNSAINDEVQTFTLELMAEKKNYMELLMQGIESLIANISSIEDVKNVLELPNAPRQDQSTDYDRLSTQAKIGYILSAYTNLRGLLSIDIFSLNNNHYHVGETLNIQQIRKEVKENLYAQALRSDHPTVWTGIEDNINLNSKYKKVITVTKVIRSLDLKSMEERPIGFLLVSYDVDVFYQYFHQQHHNDQSFLVIDGNHRVIYAPDKKRIGNSINPVFLNRLTKEQGYFLDVIEGEQMYVIYDRSNKQGWILISLVPVSRLEEKTAAIRRNTLLALLSSLFLVFLFSFLISKKMVVPLKKMVDLFKDIQKGTLDLKIRLKETSRDEIGELVRWFNTFIESLEEKKRTEEELVKSREQYRTVVNHVNEVIFQTNKEGRFTFLNPAWTVVSGYSTEESLGKNLLDYVHPEEQAKVENNFLSLARQGTAPERNLVRYLKKTGETGWLEVFPQLLRNNEGQIIGILGTLTDVTKRKQAEEQILASLREKEVLLKEIHHRVKNNLQIVSTLLQLQSSTLKNEKALEVLKESQNRVKSMALVHERLYQSKDLTQINFSEYIQKLVSTLFHSYGTGPVPIGLSVEAEEVYLNIETAIPCGLIINELVSNSLKHAFCGGMQGEVFISIQSKPDHHFDLIVRDNGIGFPESLDFRETESLGLQLVTTLVEQLEGTMLLDRREGTAFHIDFKELKYKERGA